MLDLSLDLTLFWRCKELVGFDHVVGRTNLNLMDTCMKTFSRLESFTWMIVESTSWAHGDWLWPLGGNKELGDERCLGPNEVLLAPFIWHILGSRKISWAVGAVFDPYQRGWSCWRWMWSLPTDKKNISKCIYTDKSNWDRELDIYVRKNLAQTDLVMRGGHPRDSESTSMRAWKIQKVHRRETDPKNKLTNQQHISLLIEIKIYKAFVWCRTGFFMVFFQWNQNIFFTNYFLWTTVFSGIRHFFFTFRETFFYAVFFCQFFPGIDRILFSLVLPKILQRQQYNAVVRRRLSEKSRRARQRS